MFTKIESIRTSLLVKAIRLQIYLSSSLSQRGEESASVAAITGLVLLIILAVMAIFRSALTAAFQRIASLLSF